MLLLVLLISFKKMPIFPRSPAPSSIIRSAIMWSKSYTRNVVTPTNEHLKQNRLVACLPHSYLKLSFPSLTRYACLHIHNRHHQHVIELATDLTVVNNFITYSGAMSSKERTLHYCLIYWEKIDYDIFFSTGA